MESEQLSTHKSVVIPVGDVGVQMRAEGDAVVRIMLSGRPWEHDTRACWQALVRPDQAVVDVGAYTGVYAIASALMGAKVIAIEPHPANFARLQANVAINSVRIEALWMAASDANELRMLHMKKDADVLSDMATLEKGEQGIAVIAKRIDTLQFKHRIALMKIDVEGHELSVLRGAEQTIKDHMPSLVVETLTETMSKAVTGWLEMRGYCLVTVMDGRNRLYQKRIV